MTTDAIRNEAGFSVYTPLFEVVERFRQAFKYASCLLIIIPYLFIFVLAVLTLGLIEIRQANLKEFNDLIATLDQRDWYNDNIGRHHATILDKIVSDRDDYQRWANSLSTCVDAAGDAAGGSPAGNTDPLQPADKVVTTAVTPDLPVPPPLISQQGESGQSFQGKTCAEMRAMARDHLNALSLLQESVLFSNANLTEYYDHYRAGIAHSNPQLIPVLGLLDSASSAVTLWARMPFELLEMLLLICMGALGGVISITRCFVDPAIPNPSIADLCYRPMAGGVIALGIYILFRASQLFFGGPSQNADTTLTTSIFVLAALGLASGFCAREAVAQIEFAATRILRRAEGGRDGNQPGTGEPNSAAQRGGGTPAPDRPPPI